MTGLKSSLGACLVGLLSLVAAIPAQAEVVEEAQKLLDAGDAKSAAQMMTAEVEKNPGHEEAYVVLAQAYEKTGDNDKAAETWQLLKEITHVEERLDLARRGIIRARGPIEPPTDSSEWKDDPYKVDVGDVEWKELEKVGEARYQDKRPFYYEESRHFAVFAVTEEMAKTGAMLCEKYLSFLLDKYLDGKAWALRLPILIYKNHGDYVSMGGYPDFSAGVTYSDPILGSPLHIALYMLDEDGNFDHDAVEGTLPHELTHMVVHEYFGAGDLGRWIDEGMARRMEQTRNHYEGAAKIGRDALAGEYYRFRDLFNMPDYPEGFFRAYRFYEQSASIVLYLLEQGPEALRTFLEALKNGEGYDAAVTAVFPDIPKENAVEEFEKRWVEWVERRYVQVLAKEDERNVIEASTLPDSPFAPRFDEIATADAIKTWTSISTDSLDKFHGLGESQKEWSAVDGRLVCQVEQSTLGSALAIRMNEEVPMVVKMKVRRHKFDGHNAYFGITMLDHRLDDTGIQVLVPMNDDRVSSITCVVADDIAVYKDGVCTGRAPALQPESIDEDIDYPLAIVAYDPVEVWDVQAGMIDDFVAATPKPADGSQHP